MPEIKKQLPSITVSNQPFWDAARRHELVAYKCANCGTFYAQQVLCLRCNNPRMSWVKVSGKAEVFTFCVYRQSFHPAWDKDIPYNVAYVQLAEGPILMTNIVGCENKDIYIGMPVEVVFEKINEEVTLPKFKPAK
jgi:uncharacterized OB-fold protein